MLEPFSPTFWLVVVVVTAALVMLLVLLWRKYDIEEITPLAPPFVKFKRKAQTATTNTTAPAPTPPAATPPRASVNISGNTMIGKNEMKVRGGGGSRRCRPALELHERRREQRDLVNVVLAPQQHKQHHERRRDDDDDEPKRR